MGTFFPVFIICLGALGITFLLMNVSLIFKGREFRGGCASNNPMLKSKIGECGVCGKKDGEPCAMPEVKKTNS